MLRKKKFRTPTSSALLRLLKRTIFNYNKNNKSDKCDYQRKNAHLLMRRSRDRKLLGKSISKFSVSHGDTSIRACCLQVDRVHLTTVEGAQSCCCLGRAL